MKLKYLELNNIGLYKNKRWTFHSDHKKNVIFIWGNNGAGKTTFINSIKVGLLGEKAFMMDYADYCKFITKKMISSRVDSFNSDASITIFIEVKEKNELKDYVVKREWSIKNEAFEETLHIYSNNQELNYERKEEVLNLIYEMLPPSLLDVIVFDGENVIQILSEDKMSVLIKGIVHSIFGMDVYVKLSKDLGTYLRSAKADETISSDEQVQLFQLENEYKSLYKRFNKLKSIFDAEETKRVSLMRQAKVLTSSFSQKTGINIDDLQGFNEKITDIQSQKEKKDSEIKYINEEILLYKMVQGKLEKLFEEIKEERSFKILKSIDELKKYFDSSEDALNMIIQLENMIPHQSFEFKHNVSDDDFNKLSNIIDILKSYPKSQLLDNIDEKNDFLSQIKEKLSIAGKVDDDESQGMLDKLEQIYMDLDSVRSNVVRLKQDLDNNELLLNDAKKEYENFKAMMLQRKKASNGYLTVLAYKEAIDTFIFENISSICSELDYRVQNELKKEHFRNNSISRVEISPRSFEMKVFEKSEMLIPSSLLSAGEKQVLLGLVLKTALSMAHTDTFFLFDTPVGRLDSGNRKLFTNKVVFDVSDQVFVFATDSDYSENDYISIKDEITDEFVLKRDSNDEIVLVHSSLYPGE